MATDATRPEARPGPADLPGLTDEGAPAAPDLARSTAAMTVLTLLSRGTGFVRVLVVAAVLGTTFLGNTYQSANTVPNLLFELFAAGMLQAVLIPSLVELLDHGEEGEAEHVAGAVLGLLALVLAGLAAIGALAAPWIMRALVSGVESAEVRDAQVRLGTVLLWFFLPQVVLYAAGMVATGVLNARGRFALPVFAPVVNNVVVTASYAAFWLLRDGAAPSLDLTTAQKVVLGGGTTLGVLAFSAVPVVAVVRSGFSLRPRIDLRHRAVRQLGRRGLWAAAFLAGTQVLLAVVLVLGNRVEGGVVAYQVGYTFFLLPHALFAVPVLTALFPSLARHATAGDWDAYGRAVTGGVRAIAFFVLPAAAALAALAVPLTRLAVFGETDDALVAGTVVAFAPGLVGYGAFLFLTRAAYATGDTRTPAVVNVVAVAAGSLAMVVLTALVPESALVAALAAVHSAVYLVGAGVLLLRVRSAAATTADPLAALVRPVAVTVLAAGAAAAAMWAVQQPLDPPGRLGALAQVVAAAAVGGVVYLSAQVVLRGTRPNAIPDLLRGGDA